MQIRSIALAVAAVAALGAGAVTAARAAGAATAARAAGAATAAGARNPIRPVLGDWEGSGPHGLRLSFAFVRHRRHVAVADLALGLPTGCRSSGNAAWDASAISGVEYTPPGSALHGPFPRLGGTQFELTIPPAGNQPFPVIMSGQFSNARRGTVSIASPNLHCQRGGWPKTLRFTLAAARRVPVADGTWTGNATAPFSAASGTVRIRVIDGGRIETDFEASYPCPPPGGSGNFEIGPLPTVGNLITANGTVTGILNGQTVWSAHFSRGGGLDGSVAPLGCASSAPQYPFTARRTSS